MPQIASPRPAYCASCFAHKDERFVDFEAVYDGPMIPGVPPAESMLNDLCICEQCLREACNLLDLGGKQGTIDELVGRITYLEAELDSKDKTIRGALSTIEELKEHPLAKFPGKPALVGLSDEERATVTRSRYERASKPKAVAS